MQYKDPTQVELVEWSDGGPLGRIATALERIAAALEKPSVVIDVPNTSLAPEDIQWAVERARQTHEQMGPL